jgi:hypothetical protein
MTNRTNPLSSRFDTVEPSIPKTDSQNRLTVKMAKTAKTDPDIENRFAQKSGTDCSGLVSGRLPKNGTG